MAEATTLSGSGSEETTLTKRWKAKGDSFLANKLGISRRNRKITYHYLDMLMEQLRAMLPITLLQASAVQLLLFTTYHQTEYGKNIPTGLHSLTIFQQTVW